MTVYTFGSGRTLKGGGGRTSAEGGTGSRQQQKKSARFSILSAEFKAGFYRADYLFKCLKSLDSGYLSLTLIAAPLQVAGQLRRGRLNEGYILVT